MRVLPLGDASLLIELGHDIDIDTHRRVRAVFDALAAAAIPGVIDIVPAYTGVAVHYDPLRFVRERTDPAGEAVPYDAVRRAVVHVLDEPELVSPGPGRVVEIAVRYGGEAGPDLEHVARHAGLTAEEVVALHAAAEYTVYMIGFTPGFPYLGGLPAQLATPRRSSPRLAVPAGSVGIAGAQTGIYPLSTPGGWQIIGRTDERLFRPDRDPPTLLRIGDRVRFIAGGDA
jgi:inhibitor of KinA